jgi:thiosulfate reductase cytochrome b subunit
LDTPATPRSRRDQPWIIRLTHWTNLPLLLLMAGSGLQIFSAYPYLGPRGATYHWYPLQGWVAPGWLRVGQWLAGARAVHFACMWFLVLNALIYLAFVVGSGEWRRRAFQPVRDAANAFGTGLYYLRIRHEAPKQGFYNGLQRLGYSSALVLGAALVLSGLAIWKPVQLSFLAALFGGYDGARAVHFLSLVAMAGFLLGHLLMVALHPRTLPPMLTGGPNRAADQAE